ncbi:MAG: L-2-hydroxyglutarate oxidase [Planctomycetota bacterium]
MKTVAIVGGGIVGLATAFRLHERLPDVKITILEKEDSIAKHQSGRNSGVLHSGVYYKPGSLKATNCRDGKIAMEKFCDENGIRHETCGKLIVASNGDELPMLGELEERAKKNGIKFKMFQYKELREQEPRVTGVRAMFVPSTGIVDYKKVCEALRGKITKAGHEVRLGARVGSVAVRGGKNVIKTTAGDVEADLLINCAGLYSDRIATMCGMDPGVKIIPFRGEYYELVPEKRSLVKNLVYPIPNPNFPFLGVHFTRTIDGIVECGPNAVLAYAREGYTKSKMNIGELIETLMYPGFRALAKKYWKTGFSEMKRSWSKEKFTKSLQRLVPEIQQKDLVPGHSGVRAQAVARDGSLVDDFYIQESETSIHVLNAPSPAATASLQIGTSIVDKAEPRLRK